MNRKGDLVAWAGSVIGKEILLYMCRCQPLRVLLSADRCPAASHCHAAASNAPGVQGAEGGHCGTEAVLLVA